MKAVIVAAGRGTRMPELTKNLPKALVPVAGVPVLERMLDALVATHVRDVVITTGHFAQQIKAFVQSKKKYKDLSVTYSYNPKFAETNYIYSMWVAREAIAGDDVLFSHGDMVFDQHVLEGIAASTSSAALIREGGELPQKDFKARVRDGRVTEIGVNVFGPDARACMPIYKFLESDMKLWMQEIGTFIERGEVTCYAENAFNAIADRINLRACPYTTKDLCMEVDTPEDVKEAERVLLARKGD